MSTKPNLTDIGEESSELATNELEQLRNIVFGEAKLSLEVRIEALRSEGNRVELAGIFYHVGENDMSYYPYREQAAARVQALVLESRKDLKAPNLPWYVSQQPPTDDEAVNKSDVTARLKDIAAQDKHIFHIEAFDLPKQTKKLVLDTAAIVALGELLAEAYLERQ